MSLAFAGHVQHRLHVLGLDLPAALAVIELHGREELGGLYRYELLCEAPLGADAVFADLLHRRAELKLGPRRIWGQISAARLSHARGVPRLHLTLEPRLAALSQHKLNQVFLDQSSVQTVQTVLAEQGIGAQWQDWQLQASYPPFAQRSCHEQDALSFILWLLEYEGIALRFEHTEAGERMVLFDDPSSYDRSARRYLAGLRVAPRSGLVTEADADTLTQLSLLDRSDIAAVRLSEYDHLQAGLNLSVEQGEGELTQHLHGEHYKTVAHGEQLARVRLEERQCRQGQLRGEGPLVEMQVGRVIQVLGRGLWLVTELSLGSHRDGRLHTEFIASPAEQMWRPARRTPRPKVHGLLAAKIHQGAPIAQLDEFGRYHVRYPWQDEPRSKLVRMAQAYAGPVYGNHAPLKDNTEVWLTHAHGDPDRPLIVGATHHGQEGDVVTARDNSRNVIRTRAGNKLRLEDRQGEEHIKLHTPHGMSQLVLGHAVDHAKQRRGQGVELRTQQHGAVRSGQQLLISSGHGSPRSGGEAQASASSADVRATLANLQSLIGNRSKAAGQVGVETHRGIAGADSAKTALQGTAQTAIGASKPDQIHWAESGHLLGTPTLQLAASRHLSLWSLASQDWTTGSKLQIAVKAATRIHVEQSGRKAFVSGGDALTTVSKGRLHLKVQGCITLQSQSGDLSFKAQGSSLKLTAGGHAGFKSAGSTLIQTSKHGAKAGAVNLQGGSTAQIPGTLASTAPKPASNWLELKRLDDGLNPLPAKVTATFANGEHRQGQLDANGYFRFEDVPAGLARIAYEDPPPQTLVADDSLAKLPAGLHQLLGGA